VQGDIEAVAGKQPLDLTKLFESISGSDAYKADYEKYDAEMKDAQEKLAFVQSKKKTTAAEKRQKKEQKVEAERHLKMQEQLVTNPAPPLSGDLRTNRSLVIYVICVRVTMNLPV